MDKYEYKVRAEEIKSLISEGEYAEAVKIADTIDWRRVKSVMMLCTISDLYKINKRYQESKDILLMAYEKHPGGRLIVYNLCELCIKMNETVEAMEYYKEFVNIAPKDSGRYILLYKLYELNEVTLEERIAVLEEFKKKDYREKWAYELAFLYHRVGMATKCVEECDEMFLWFGEGGYVLKALDLKKLHQPLTEDQEKKYKYMLHMRELQAAGIVEEESEEENTADQGEESDGAENEVQSGDTIMIKPVDVGQYNTMNLQKELAESMKEILSDDQTGEETSQSPLPIVNNDTGVVSEAAGSEYTTKIDPIPQEDEELSDKQNEVEIAGAESGQEPVDEQLTGYIDIQQEKEIVDEAVVSPVLQEEAEEEKTDVQTASEATEEAISLNTISREENLVPEIEMPVPTIPVAPIEEVPVFPVEPLPESKKDLKDPKVVAEIMEQPTRPLPNLNARDPKEDERGKVIYPTISTDIAVDVTKKKSDFDGLLSQEYDGQISMVIPEKEKIEKQITGQMSIDDVLLEWEKTKKKAEEKRREEVRKKIAAQTDNLFEQFDEATKSGLLEQLENAVVDAMDRTEVKAPSKILEPENPREIPDAHKPATNIANEVDENDGVEELEVVEEETASYMPTGDTDSWKALEVSVDVDALVDNSFKEAIEEAKAEEEQEIEETEEIEGVEEELEDEPEEIETPEAEEEASDSDDTEENEEGLEEDNSEEESSSESESSSNDDQEARKLTLDEREHFSHFIQNKKTRQQLATTLDGMTMAAYTGNVIITGEESESTLALAKSLVKEVQATDDNFSGKVARISASVLNKKDVKEIFGKLENGALIIEDSTALDDNTIKSLTHELEKENKGILVMLEGTRDGVNAMLVEYPALLNNFTNRIDIESLDDDALVKFAKQYAEENEYSIDEMGILALHTRIAEMQTSDHEVTIAEVKDLMEDAFYFADKKTPKHFMDILLGKRYDDKDMVILREKDFIRY